MKISETRQRDCCQPQDLKPIEGSPLRGRDPLYKFCVHCGRHHMIHTFMDAAGSRDWEYRPMKRPWETKSGEFHGVFLDQS